MAATASSCYPDYDQGVVAPRTTHTHKDYSRPLHVDCSVEYELPNAAKPPAGGRSEPLLMIHPCYYRRAESQRRSPFINNLPAPRRTTTTTAYQSVRYVDPARQAAAAGKRDPLLCSSADSGHWTDTERSPLVAQQGPEQRLPPAGPDSGIATTPVGDDKLNLPDVLDEIRLLVSGVHPINQVRATYGPRATCGPQASYLWCPALHKQHRRTLMKSWTNSVKCSAIQT